jgi:hypothetical protein
MTVKNAGIELAGGRLGASHVVRSVDDRDRGGHVLGEADPLTI